MLDKKSFADMESYIKEEDSQREEIIVRSRTVLKNSKAAIYSLHRKEITQAKKSLDDAKKTISDLRKIIEKHPHLKQNLDNALEEYCEACCFYGFIVDKKIPIYTELSVDPYTYLGGLSDLTGELSRRSVLEAIVKNKPEVKAIRELVEEIHGAFIKFDLRNGDLRKKADAIKWNLNKIEEILYDLNKK